MRLKENIFFQWLTWQFFDVPKEILIAWKNILLFNLNYFSIYSLLKTFFSPWRRYREFYRGNFNIGRYLEVLFSNLIYRLLGMIMRFFLLTVDLFLEIIIFFIGLIIFFGWLILPIILVVVLIFGFQKIL